VCSSFDNITAGALSVDKKAKNLFDWQEAVMQ